MQRQIYQDNLAWLDETCKSNINFFKLEADVEIAKSVHNLLPERIVDLERYCWHFSFCE